MAVRINADNENVAVASGLPTAANWSASFHFRINTDRNALGYIFLVANSAGSSYNSLYLASDGTSLRSDTTSNTIAVQGLTAGTWYHIGLVKIGNDLRIYVNDSLQATHNVGSTFTADRVIIGGLPTFYPDADYAYVKIWNDDLTAGEMADEADYADPVRTADLAAWYEFEDGSLTVDSSGNGQTLGIGGTPTFAADPSVPYQDTGIEGVAAITLADATLSAAGVLPLAGTSTPTLAAATLDSAGALSLTGTLTATLADATLDSAGVLGVDGSGTASVTLADASLGAAGALSIAGASAITLADATTAGVGALAIIGESAIALADSTLSSVGTEPALSAGTFGTPTVTLQESTHIDGNLTPDGYTWAQGTPFVIDNYGHYIAQAQYYDGGNIANGFVVSGDQGATWVDPTLSGFFDPDGEYYLERGGMAYDSTNDLIHMLWLASASSDGMIYRRYSLTRDGSNNITTITRVSGINLQLDYDATDYQHPVLKWLPDGTHGRLVAIWGALDSGGDVEFRATQRLLSNSVADNTAGNWSKVRASSSTAVFGTVTVEYSSLGNIASAGTPYVSANFKTGGSDEGALYLLYAAASEWRVRAYEQTDTDEWDTLAFDSLVSDVTRSGSAGGYLLKFQLATEPRYHAQSDTMVFGIATRADGDDEWTLGKVDSSGNTDIEVVYAAANSENNWFITGDVMPDNASGHILVTYTDLPDKDAFATSYNSDFDVIAAPVIIFSSAPADIPTIYHELDDDLLLVLLRDFNAAATEVPPTFTPPYDGWFVSVEYTALDPVLGTTAVTLASATVNTTGELDIAATVAITLSDATTGSVGALALVGVATSTLADATLASAGILPIVGTSIPALADATLSASGDVVIVGVASVILADAALDADGVLIAVGSGALAVTLGSATLAATGVVAIAATATITLTDATLISDANLVIAGALAKTLADATLAASGVFGDVIAGGASITLANATLTSAGTLAIQAATGATLDDASISATGTLSIAALAAITLSPATLSSIGTVVILGAATLMLADATVSATGAKDLNIPTMAAVVYGPSSSGFVYSPVSIGTIGD